MNSKQKRTFFSVSKAELSILALFALFFLCGAWLIVPHTRLNPAHRRAEAEYRQLHERLQLGMTTHEVQYTFATSQSKNLTFHSTGSEIWISTPMLLSAKNWQMRLQFKDDRLIRVHSQVADYDSFPEGAPPDKTAP